MFRNPKHHNLMKQICGHRVDYKEYKLFIKDLQFSENSSNIVTAYNDIDNKKGSSKSWKDKFKCKKQYEINLTKEINIL